mmetsp:Transcript_15073/g.32176  ORF Transcript_15073/g.32176 Transcript_15073/m.32176 type:complete len:227 (+) Transcript_15073:311-991(+)
MRADVGMRFMPIYASRTWQPRHEGSGISDVAGTGDALLLLAERVEVLAQRHLVVLALACDHVVHVAHVGNLVFILIRLLLARRISAVIISEGSLVRHAHAAPLTPARVRLDDERAGACRCEERQHDLVPAREFEEQEGGGEGRAEDGGERGGGADHGIGGGVGDGELWDDAPRADAYAKESLQAGDAVCQRAQADARGGLVEDAEHGAEEERRGECASDEAGADAE